MVTLLVLQYKASQKLPRQLSEFYDRLFQTLLQRHDGTKPGFARTRRCNLDDGEYRRVFEMVSMLLKGEDGQCFSSDTIYEAVSKSLSDLELEAKATPYTEDIIRITCLILREGAQHRFIHKSVQEYYAASYVARKPDRWAKSFYGAVLDNREWRKWSQELEFLSEIDAHRYQKYYELPAILEFLDSDQAKVKEGTPQVSQEWLHRQLDKVQIRPPGKRSWTFSFTPGSSPIRLLFMREIRKRVSDIFDEQNWQGHLLDEDADGNGIFGTVLLKQEPFSDPMRAIGKKFYSSMVDRAREILTQIEKEEDDHILSNLM